MDKNLDFLTKPLVDEAILIIDKNGIPSNREGKGYAVSIGNKQYPFKLIVTESARIAGLNLTSNDFYSSEANRNSFEKLTDYSIIKIGAEMEYFHLDQIRDYKNEAGRQYMQNSKGVKCYNDTRLKLQHLGKLLGESFSIDLINNYNEKPNKMAGQGKGFVQKDYILSGFLPKKHYDKGNQIFIKLVFAGFSSKIKFGIDVDVNFSDENNHYNKNRKSLQKESHWETTVDENFPTNWEDLLNVISPVFKKQLIIINDFLSHKEKVMELNQLIRVLKYKKQIILQGPPGTGKTKMAKDIAVEMLSLGNLQELDDNEQCKLIQFHPSYTYEDFVRGIISVPNEDGEGILFKTENKILAEFAEKALKNKLDSQKGATELSKEKWIVEQFDKFVYSVAETLEVDENIALTESVVLIAIDEDAFRYKGVKGWTKRGNRMLFKDIKQAFLDENFERQDLKYNKNLSGLAKWHASYYVRVLDMFKKFLLENKIEFITNTTVKEELKDFVLIIDEINRANISSVLGELIYALEYRDELVESIYEFEGSRNITLPDNLFIIGTMNTADRSVGHIDYAIKRRFAFVDVLPKNLKAELETDFDESLFIEVANLFIANYDPSIDYGKELKNIRSVYLNSDFDPKEVWLGHSYFIKQYEKDDNGKNIIHKPYDFKMRLDYEIKPILLEYVKDGILKESAKVEIEKLKATI